MAAAAAAGTPLAYLGRFPLMAELSEYVESKGLGRSPRFCWTTFAGADRSEYDALVLWLPIASCALPQFQFCPVRPTRPDRAGIAKWAWTWDGDVERPSLEESIRCVLRDPALQWHGYLRRGCWEPC